MNVSLFSRWLSFVIFISLPVIAQAQLPDTSRRLGTLSGRVLFAGDNHPAGAVRVEIHRMGGAFAGTAFTGSDGSFSLEGLPLDTYSVSIVAPCCASLRQTVSLTAGFTPVELRLSRNASPVAANGSSSSVSAHELSIPEKARKSFEKGQKLLAGKDAASSVSEFQRAVAAFPSYYEAYYQMGLAQVELTHPEGAMEAFRKSIETSGGRYAPAHFALGLLLCYKHDFAAAESALRQGLALDPWSAKGEYALALALFGLNRLEEAEKNAREAATRSAHFAEPYLLLAEIHSRRNDEAALVADLEAYLRLEPNGEHSGQARSLLQQAQRALAGTNAAVALAQPQN